MSRSTTGGSVPDGEAFDDRRAAGRELRRAQRVRVAVAGLLDFGPAYGPPAGLFNFRGHNRSIGQILFADGHADSFRDADKNGTFAPQANAGGQPVVPINYPDFGSRVFFGTLTNGKP